MKIPTQGRDEKELEANLQGAAWLVQAFVWLVGAGALAALIVALGGCAEPVRVYKYRGVMVHENDLSPCEPHAAGCFSNGQAYVLAGDQQVLDHEIDHYNGLRHGKWKPRGYEVCALIEAQGSTGWWAGRFICRRADGSFYQRDAI